MPNYKIYIINDRDINSPIGIPGELCISGEGLGRGYLNNPSLTAEKFVNNPFESETKMYKTGDLARWTEDGNIEYLGRIDNQVKIRGFRIEVGEIENRLLQHENIKEAVVIANESYNNEKYLCAYVVSNKPIEELNLKAYLSNNLPEYMIPTFLTALEKLPMTPNGKLSIKELPVPNMENNLIKFEAPSNEVEEILVGIWSEVLEAEKIGINDNFFELGGHSLKAMLLISKIHKELNKEVPLVELFKSPTIKGISEYLQDAKENIYSGINKVMEKDFYEASSAQKRMYILGQFDKTSVVYNMPAIYEIHGNVNREKLQAIFRELVKRHEALRTYFETVDGEIVQKIHNNYEFIMEYRIASRGY